MFEDHSQGKLCPPCGVTGSWCRDALADQVDVGSEDALFYLLLDAQAFGSASVDFLCHEATVSGAMAD